MLAIESAASTIHSGDRLSGPVRFFPLAVIISVIIFHGCSTYQSLTAYFNTYYNAGRLFDEATDQIETSTQTVSDSSNLATFNVSKDVDDKLDKVIEKCSKLLQFYPNSKWVEGAIMMIGKSYVYKGESESALRKFKELLDNFPGSDYRFEARLWSAMAEYHMRQDDEALKLLKDLYTDAKAQGKDDITLRSLVLQGQIFFARGEYNQAASAFAPALDLSGDNRIRSVACFQLGLCYQRLGDPAKAAEAYGRVVKLGPDFSLEFRARLREAMMLAAAQNYKGSLAKLDDLRGEPLKPDERGLVEIEIANDYRQLGDSAKAFQLYDMIDTTYRRTEAAARSYFERAVVYERGRRDLRLARSYYDSAKNEYANTDINAIAQRKSKDLADYFSYKGNVARYDSLLDKALHPDTIALKKDSTAGPDSLRSAADSVRKQFVPPDIVDQRLKPPPEKMQADTLKSERRVPSGRDSLPSPSALLRLAAKQASSQIRGPADSAGAKHDSTNMAAKQAQPSGDTANRAHPAEAQVPVDTFPGYRSGRPARDSALTPAASPADKHLAQSGAARVDSPRAEGKPPAPPPMLNPPVPNPQIGEPANMGQDRPPGMPEQMMPGGRFPGLRPGMGSPDSIEAARLAGRDMAQRARTGFRGIPDSLLRPNDSLNTRRGAPPPAPVVLSPDSLRSLIATTKFELAGLFYLELNLPDSALLWYQKIVDEYPASPFVPRCLYAMAEIDRVQGDSLAMDSLYNLIVKNYRQSEYGVQVNRLLGNDASPEFLDSAALAFARAESLLQAGSTSDAISAYAQIPDRYPSSSIVPKALYAVGWIYENVLVLNDSAARWYKVLLREYPSSPYAANVQAQVAVRDDPKTLSQYVKIKEIQALGKPKPGKGEKPEGVPGVKPGEELQDEDEDIQKLRREDRNDDDNQDEDQDNSDDDSPDSDDGGN